MWVRSMICWPTLITSTTPDQHRQRELVLMMRVWMLMVGGVRPL